MPHLRKFKVTVRRHNFLPPPRRQRRTLPGGQERRGWLTAGLPSPPLVTGDRERERERQEAWLGDVKTDSRTLSVTDTGFFLKTGYHFFIIFRAHVYYESIQVEEKGEGFFLGTWLMCRLWN